MAEQKLGLLRAVVIVWVSSAVVGVLLTHVFFQSAVGSTIVLGAPTARHPFALLAAFEVTKAFVAAIAVCVGVRIVGFRVIYPIAAVALALPAILATAVAWAAFSKGSSDPTGIALSAYALLLVPLQILVGTFVPAYVIDAAAARTAGSAPPDRPHYPTPRG